jgi:hypothetical protein
LKIFRTGENLAKTEANLLKISIQGALLMKFVSGIYFSSFFLLLKLLSHFYRSVLHPYLSGTN